MLSMQMLYVDSGQHFKWTKSTPKQTFDTNTNSLLLLNRTSKCDLYPIWLLYYIFLVTTPTFIVPVSNSLCYNLLSVYENAYEWTEFNNVVVRIYMECVKSVLIW